MNGVLAKARRAPVIVFTLFALTAGPLALAAGVGTAIRQVQALTAGDQPRKAAKAATPELGADVDGDGEPDFVNPTGMPLREVDAFGSGAFLASRDGGVRHHQGADYLVEHGHKVVAPMSGYVTKIGFAYAGDEKLRYVELTNQAIGYVVRVFYLQPVVVLGQAVRLGQTVGLAETLQRRYPGITDHIHIEVAELARGRVDPAKLIPPPESYL